MNEYTEIDVSQVPDGAVWIIPRRHQGQMVEVAYSTGRREGNWDADEGDPYRRDWDRSDNHVTYYKRGGRRAVARKDPAREDAIDAVMQELYGTAGPDEDIGVVAVRAMLGRLYDQGKAAR